MKFTLTVIFVVTLGNMYASSTTTTTTASSETSSFSSLTTINDKTSTLNDSGTTETITSTGTPPSGSTTHPKTATDTDQSTITSSSTTTTFANTEYTTTSSSESTTEILTSISTSETPSGSPTSTISTSETPSGSPTSTISTSDTPSESPTSTISTSETPSGSTISTISTSETPSESPTSTISTSETPSESPTSTLNTSSTSFQTTASGSFVSSTVTDPSKTSTETSPQSSTNTPVTNVSVPAASTTVTTANLATEETTTEETSTVEGTQESTMTEEPTSTSSTTLLPTTTLITTPHPTTPVYSINDEITLTTDDAVIPLSISVTFKGCVKEKDALANLTVEILKLDTCKSVFIESATGCGDDTSKTILFRVHVLARSLLNGEKDLIIENITTTINNTEAVSMAQDLVSSNITACSSITCQQALLYYKGFNCNSIGNNCTLTSPCINKGPCKNEGTCYVKANGTHYIGLCKCSDDDMYTYSGSQCESKAYSWRLWTIVASGVGGGIIIILLFAVVIQCARKKAGSFNQKYGYDSGFDDRENLMYDRRYVSSDEYHRKPIPREEDIADQVNLQSFENKGYDHWEPSDSKETYASMDRHFQDPTFHAQITRPKLTTNKYGTDQLTPF